jgi:hypothetical protein
VQEGFRQSGEFLVLIPPDMVFCCPLAALVGDVMDPRPDHKPDLAGTVLEENLTDWFAYASGSS